MEEGDESEIQIPSEIITREKARKKVAQYRIEIPSADKYYSCNDARKNVCRFFASNNRCKLGLKCRFYHPVTFTPDLQKEVKRQLRKCYCGSDLITIINNKPLISDTEITPDFFIVCRNTGKSMKKCKK